MLVKNKPIGAFKIFYAVFAYIIVFALWWDYLLYAKNEEAFKEKIELNQINFEMLHPSGDYYATKEYAQIISKYSRQKVMIIGEGVFFLLLLFFGLMRVRRVFLRELELVDLQRNFMLSITHELKSPLSTIKLTLQTLHKRQLDIEKSTKLISNSLTDLDRLESLVDNILFASKIEREEPGFSNEPTDVAIVIRSIADRLSYNKKSIAIKTEVPKEVYLDTDLMGFTSVVVNLLENAIKYSASGSEINIGLEDNLENVVLWVRDQGMGIAEKEKGKIFQKFYRIGNEDTRNAKGTGLGLYIVKRFVEIYKGTISVEDSSPRGSLFIIRLPRQ
ncbi:MAG: HAMP domain-containing histidine kinase [Bacteroidetes bacterium]|nr:HAMP domain-containing histidine kinase [Bacteroidota bacterium]